MDLKLASGIAAGVLGAMAIGGAMLLPASTPMGQLAGPTVGVGPGPSFDAGAPIKHSFSGVHAAVMQQCANDTTGLTCDAFDTLGARVVVTAQADGGLPLGDAGPSAIVQAPDGGWVIQ